MNNLPYSRFPPLTHLSRKMIVPWDTRHGLSLSLSLSPVTHSLTHRVLPCSCGLLQLLSYKKVHFKRNFKRSKVRLAQPYFYVSNVENFPNVQKFVPNVSYVWNALSYRRDLRLHAWQTADWPENWPPDFLGYIITRSTVLCRKTVCQQLLAR